jgi:microsomal dipeptidase-like Zn-dependent dipeptidase
MPALLVLAAAVAVLALLPVLLDAALNRRGRVAATRWTPAARALHARLWIADLHADSLLWDRDLLRRHRRGHVDLPRLIEGNVALQVFTVVSKMPFLVSHTRTPATSDMVAVLAVLSRWPPRTWVSLYARAAYHAARLHRFARRSGGRLTIVRTARDLDAAGNGRVAAVLGLEGAQVLEGNLATLDGLFAAGFRLMGLTHFFDTEVAGSAHGMRKGGLTPLGRQVIPRMERLGMVVDLAHASAATIEEVTALATRPVIVSHTGVRGTHDHPRNLSDDQLRRVAATGGAIGIAYFRRATGGTDVASIVAAMRYAADRIGPAHVALGSDFDGTVRTPFDCTGLLAVTDGLLAAGCTDDEIAGIMGGNARRVLRATLPPG